jgi:acetylornithine/N-succinyldiaminopimelate aminotransferase
MPLGAFISSGSIMSSLSHDPPLGHITTFGGHPLCCAAGLASLEVIITEQLAEKAREKEIHFREELSHLAVREIRGEGLLLAVVPEDRRIIPQLITRAPEHGLLLDYFLFCDSAFRVAPPLTITHDEISLACQRLGDLMRAMA